MQHVERLVKKVVHRDNESDEEGTASVLITAKEENDDQRDLNTAEENKKLEQDYRESKHSAQVSKFCKAKRKELNDFRQQQVCVVFVYTHTHTHSWTAVYLMMFSRLC